MDAHRNLTKQGFTIVELLIVIIVIGILAAISLTAYSGSQQRANQAALQTHLADVTKQLKSYYAEHGQYPGGIDDCPAPSSGNMCATLPDGVTTTYRSNPPAYSSFAINVSEKGESVGRTATANPTFGGYNMLAEDPGEKTPTNEFLRYVDIAPIIDEWGLVPYTISFDIKSASVATKNTVNVYIQNGSGGKYTFGMNVPVTTSYVRQQVTVTPSVWMPEEKKAYLAFYGTYNTGNKPTVKNVKIELAN